MVKQWFLAIALVIFLIVMVLCLAARLLFLTSSEIADGKIIEVSSQNGVCGDGRRNSHRCTKYYAYIEILETPSSAQSPLIVRVWAGSSRGLDKPVERAELHLHERARVIYDPHDTNDAHEIGDLGFWTRDLLVFIFIVGIIASAYRFGILPSS